MNLAYDYTGVGEDGPRTPFLSRKLNNIGDPWQLPATFTMHARDEELRVLRFFSQLWGFDCNGGSGGGSSNRNDTTNTWGYVTSSGTEGNTQGVLLGREALPGARLFASAASHYSVFKIARMLRIPCVTVPALRNGQMDCEALDAALHRTPGVSVCGAIVVANLGTTMTGAIDDVREMHRVLCRHGLGQRYYMHADAALMGVALPFLERDLFFKAPLHSMSISGHKFLGTPFPCGVFLCERRWVVRRRDAEYIGCDDCTIAGSRSGHAALLLDHVLRQKGAAGLERDVLACVDNAELLVRQLNGATRGAARAWRNHNSLTVVFRRPPPNVLSRWQLAPEGTAAHAVVLPHVTREVVGRFVHDYARAVQHMRPLSIDGSC